MVTYPGRSRLRRCPAETEGHAGSIRLPIRESGQIGIGKLDRIPVIGNIRRGIKDWNQEQR